MRSEERKLYILKVAKENGFVSIPKTAQFLGISIESIRRDISDLCKKNQLKKVYGGAIPIKDTIWRSSAGMRNALQNQQSRIAIAKEAANMIRDDQVVCLDCFELTGLIAEHVKNVYNVTFVVNSLKVAVTLCDKINAGDISGTVIMVGGQLVTNSYRCYTLSSLDIIERYYYDLAFISPMAMSASGVSCTSTNPGLYIQHIMGRATSSVLVVESYKLGKHSVMDFAKPTDFDRIITDDSNPVPADLLKVLQDSNTQLTVIASQ